MVYKIKQTKYTYIKLKFEARNGRWVDIVFLPFSLLPSPSLLYFPTSAPAFLLPSPLSSSSFPHSLPWHLSSFLLFLSLPSLSLSLKYDIDGHMCANINHKKMRNPTVMCRLCDCIGITKTWMDICVTRMDICVTRMDICVQTSTIKK